MKRFLLVALISGLYTAASAQTGFEWINFTSPYYKISVGKDAIHRLTRADLIAAGLPSFVDPRTIKLYHRGIEQAIYVEGENDSQLNASDFVEFYGKKNDGTLDQQLFTSPTAQPHKLYNLFSDTTAYFLTYGGAAGKRANTNAVSTLNSPESFHWDEKLVLYHDQYAPGIDYGDIQLTAFENGEGWTSPQILQNQSNDFLVSGITNSVPSAGVPHLEVVFTGRGPSTHNIEISAGARFIASTTVSAFNSVKYETDLQWSDISPGGQFTLRIRVLGLNGLPARASVGYIRITYPQTVNATGATEKYFTFPENPSGTIAASIQSPPAGAVVYDVTNPDHVKRIPSSFSTTLDFVLGDAAVKRKVFVSNTFVAPKIRRVSFRQINPSSQDYVIITHSSLRKPVAGYTDPVKALGEFRALPQGGSFDTLIVNIDQLYNQFSYGETTPLAIFNFLKFLKTGQLPRFLLLVGKGLDVNYGYHRNPASYPQFKDLVPTAGYPASDMAFSSGLSATAGIPAVATGRLSAMGPADVAAYLNKLKEFEAQPFDNLRRKNLLHLSGGLYNNEPQEFRAILESFGTVAESYRLGGNVKAIAKQTTDIEVINVADEVNKGLNLITLFGHSSPSSGDFDIGLVTDPLMGYNNKGKYPALLLNGCLAGSYFLDASIFGENWTNAPDRGAIGIIAHSSYGFASHLKIYSDFFYKVAFGDSTFINKGIGEVQREIARRFYATYSNSPVTQSQVQQMVLLGDPAVSLFAAPKPDYAIVPNSVLLQTNDGSKLSAFSDSLSLQMIINNYGQAKNKKIRVSVTRTLNDNSTVTYDTLINATLYSDTISVLLPGRISQGFGNNNFAIKVDSDGLIDELNETNNSYEKIFFIPLSGTKNLYPNEYAIVNTLTPRLSFQHTDQLSGEREFLLQIDTSKTFNSAFAKEFVIKAKVLASQQVALSAKDSVVYYWRTKLKDPQANENNDWELSSFAYINNGPAGWTQRTFGQFEENLTEGLQKNSGSRQIEFGQTTTDVAVVAYGPSVNETSSVKINNAEYNLFNQTGNFQCRDNTINLIAFDKTTTQPYAGLYFTWIELRDNFGSAALLCGREPYVINSFLASEVAQGLGGDLIQYINNISAGDSVLLFTMGDAGIPSWPAGVKEKIGELGVSVAQLDQLQNGEPVVIFARKGAPAGTAQIYRTDGASPADGTVSVNRTVTGRESEGMMTTGLIGPALKWSDFLVNYSVDHVSDQVNFTIHGVDLTGKTTLLFDNVKEDISLSSIDPNLYPFIRISYLTRDETFVTAAKLNRWMVTYEPAAEGLLLFNGEQQQQVVSEGQSWTANYSFINISDKSFGDSLSINYHIIRSGTSFATENSLKARAPMPGDTTDFSIAFPTRHHSGINDLFVFVNPRVQPENDFDNNFITLPKHLKVLPDTIAPVLEVTFDGRFISQLEFVSPHPDITIKIIDNNPFLLITDTTNVKLFLQVPCEDLNCVFTPLYFSSSELTWSAETFESEFVVNYRPMLSTEGIYTLRVIANDVTGNKSGVEPYEISFTVAHEDRVTLLPPYPNPFDDRATFVVEVSGETLPSEIEMTLFNTNGSVVRQFAAEDFGAIHFGRNMFSWEGLDAQGRPVPNGMYIYRLRIKSSDQVVEKTGKLSLIR